MVKSLRVAFLMLMTCFAVVANAQSVKSYTENLVVTINGVSAEPQLASVNVEYLENGNINFTLNDFILSIADDIMPVGNISVSDLALADEGYCKSFSYDGNILILPGGNEIVFDGETFEMEEDDWVGPSLDEIPLKLNGKMTDDKLYVTIDITLAALGQVVEVVLGEDIVKPEEPEEPEGPAVINTKNFTENLVVTINDVVSTPQPASVNVAYLEDGNINFTLNDFILTIADDIMPVGNIAVKNLVLSDEGYCKSFEYEGNITISAGGNEIVFDGETFEMEEDDWVGPSLDEIPLKLKGKMTDDKLYVTIDIMMVALSQEVHVVLGEDIKEPIEPVEPEEPEGPAVVDTKNYTENLVVTINDVVSTPQPASVNVAYLEDGNINFTLNDFILSIEDDIMPVGNISVKNLALSDEGYCKSFSYEGNIVISAGSKEIIYEGETFEMEDDDWVGPSLEEIPLKLHGKMTDDKLYVTIDITMAALGQEVKVVLGEDIIDPVIQGISSVAKGKHPVGKFDVSGRAVISPNAKGLYIIGGKKVLKY